MSCFYVFPPLNSVKTDRSAVPEHHAAVLPVKREVVDFDGTGALVDSRGQPDHATVRIYQSVSVERHLKTPVHTSHTNRYSQVTFYGLKYSELQICFRLVTFIIKNNNKVEDTVR